eukprot:745853-Hanusia_phi.AAC.1
MSDLLWPPPLFYLCAVFDLLSFPPLLSSFDFCPPFPSSRPLSALPSSPFNIVMHLQLQPLRVAPRSARARDRAEDMAGRARGSRWSRALVSTLLRYQDTLAACSSLTEWQPLWDIIQEDESFLLTSSSASSSSLPSEVKKEASTTPAHEELSQNRKLFFELLLQATPSSQRAVLTTFRQRIIDFRITGDVDGVLVLLDAGADVYEMKGAGKIKSVLQTYGAWSYKGREQVREQGEHLAARLMLTAVSVKYALRAQGGDSTLGSEEASHELLFHPAAHVPSQIIFSSSGLVRSIRAHG